MTPAALHKFYLGLLLAVVALAVSVIEYKAIEQKGALKVLTAQNDSTVKARSRKALSDSLVAAQAVKDAETAKGKALALVAVGKALQAHTDSVARSASAERDAAQRIAADSAASLGVLRAEIGRLVLTGRADSAAADAQRRADAVTIRGLLATTQADSTALSAEQRRSQSLQALTETYAKEITLLKKSQPSTFGNVVRVVGWAGAGYLVGRVVK